RRSARRRICTRSADRQHLGRRQQLPKLGLLPGGQIEQESATVAGRLAADREDRAVDGEVTDRAERLGVYRYLIGRMRAHATRAAARSPRCIAFRRWTASGVATLRIPLIQPCAPPARLSSGAIKLPWKTRKPS